MGNGHVASGFCYAQSTQTPQWRRAYTHVLLRDAGSGRRIVAEFGHEVSGVHVPDARSGIVQAFLDHPKKPEWLWMHDTDATYADDVVEQLIAAAHPKTRPIVGALAFGVRPLKDANGVEMFNDVAAAPLELFPTLYLLTEAGKVLIHDYPPDTLIQVHATGCHCLLIHRSVLDDPRWGDGHPLKWFRTTVMNGDVVSEDQFFCLKAGSLGYPIHVHTGIRTGHVKTFVADEDMYRSQRAS